MAIQTKTFDAIGESCKWREAASRKLDSMSHQERMAYLKSMGERVRAELTTRHSGNCN
jgi:hypothetical protein